MAQLTRAIIDAEHFVARYARGSLSEPEREAFEQYCVLHPEVAEQVATDRAMFEGLRAMERKRARPRRPLIHYALAAGVAALALAASIWSFYGGGTEAAAMYAAAEDLPALLRERVSTPLRVVAQRGGALRLEAPPGHDVLKLEIVVDGASAGVADVSVIEYAPDGEMHRGKLRTPVELRDGEPLISILLDTSTLRGDRLRIDVSAPGAAQAYELRVVRAP
jgi:hypothetical protein